MRQTILALLVSSCFAGRASAQQAAPQPYYYYAPPRPQLIVNPAELEQRGHRKKVIGAVLIGIGVGLSAIGIGFAIDGAMHAQCSGHEEHAVCTPSSATSRMELGSTAAVVGGVLAIVGTPIYIVGGVQVSRARRLYALMPAATE
jgi:hypothetical protein